MTRKTALHKNHIAAGAKMGGFAGYDMPLFYADGVMKEHEWVRSHAGIFDVSHMGQVIIEGQGAAEFFERLTPSAFKTKKSGRAHSIEERAHFEPHHLGLPGEIARRAMHLTGGRRRIIRGG